MCDDNWLLRIHRQHVHATMAHLYGGPQVANNNKASHVRKSESPTVEEHTGSNENDLTGRSTKKNEVSAGSKHEPSTLQVLCGPFTWVAASCLARKRRRISAGGGRRPAIAQRR